MLSRIYWKSKERNANIGPIGPIGPTVCSTALHKTLAAFCVIICQSSARLHVDCKMNPLVQLQSPHNKKTSRTVKKQTYYGSDPIF
jgi:hypothetical protein